MSKSDESAKRPGGLGGLLYHNSFVLAVSFVVAMITWFMVASSNTESNTIIRDVPIEVQRSASAEQEGLRVFEISYNEADLEIEGSTLITARLTADDFNVFVNFNPVSTKVTGNTLQRTTLKVTAAKKASISDYNIVSVNPEEVTVVYDRYKEVTLPLGTEEINYSVQNGFYSDTAVLSEDTITLSGPESSVNRISRAAVSVNYGTALKENTTFTGSIVLYDQENNPIDWNEAAASLYLEASITEVDVTVPVLATKEVTLEPIFLHRPAGFPDSKISVTPDRITIAGTPEALAQITSIQLDPPIDFAAFSSAEVQTNTLEIPLPTGVRNLNAAGDSAAGQATVTVNLNSYETRILTVPAENMQFANIPEGLAPTLENAGLEVTVAGPEALMARLLGDSLSVQIDLANFAGQVGRLQIPASVTVAGEGADACWVLGSYTVTLTLEDAATAAANQNLSSEDTGAASPQE